MPLRSLIKSKGDQEEGWSDRNQGDGEDKYYRSSHRISKSSFVSAIRKALGRYSSATSQSHSTLSPVSFSTFHIFHRYNIFFDIPSISPVSKKMEGFYKVYKSLTDNQTPVTHDPQLATDDDGRRSATPLNNRLNTMSGPSASASKARTAAGSRGKEENNFSPISLVDNPNPGASVLSQQEIQRLFSGAPVFTALGKKGSGDVHPRVLFPFDDCVEGGLSDCLPIEHPAFSLCTSRLHRTPSGHENLLDQGLVNEEPSMLSFSGVEPGTCGWEYFLKYPIGDSENKEDEEEDSAEEGGRERGMRRASLGNAKGGLRTVEMEYVTQRLNELGEIYHESKREPENEQEPLKNETNQGILGKYSSLELYTNLFTRLLFPPTRITTADYHDPYSLKVQIVALRQALAMERLWLNFSRVDWRIKLGQILWGRRPTVGSGSEVGDEEDEDEEAVPPGNEAERTWLLLQILLACELVIRMDAIVSNDGDDEDAARPKDDVLSEFKTIGSKKVEWDIILARRWLENIRVADSEAGKEKEKEEPPPPPPVRKGWFGSRSTEPSLPTGQGNTEGNNDGSGSGLSYDASFSPRNQLRQLNGLLYFAKRLQWPQLDTLFATLQEKLRSTSTFSTPAQSVYGTPLDVTPSMVSISGSYFPPARPRRVRELSSSGVSFKGTERGSKPSAIANAMGYGGWLSRTYFTGLILPGEGLSHFLISTLLENDTAATEKLGYQTNLYNGFQYEGSTWWSSYSIVGKVLAGYEGSKEVAGWIGPCPGSGLGEEGMIEDGWVDIVTMQPDEEEPRVANPSAIKEDSNPLGKGPKGTREILSTDFTIPSDEFDQEERVTLEGLVFKVTSRDEDEFSGPFARFDVEVHLSILSTNEKRAINLRHDVFFVSSFPCLETPSVDLVNSSHPLHKDFSFQSIPVEQLTEDHFKERNDDVIVIQVGGSDGGGQVLARAWCAMAGMHAVVGRKGRTCLSCCIREARGLGVGVVIRIGA